MVLRYTTDNINKGPKQFSLKMIWNSFENQTVEVRQCADSLAPANASLCEREKWGVHWKTATITANEMPTTQRVKSARNLINQKQRNPLQRDADQKYAPSRNEWAETLGCLWFFPNLARFGVRTSRYCIHFISFEFASPNWIYTFRSNNILKSKISSIANVRTLYLVVAFLN